MATVRASHAALPFLERAAEGAIVNVSSISALRATKRNPPYGAIKAAVDHYTSSQARMLAARGIRVNAVAPGSIEFPGGTWERRRTQDPALYNAHPRANPVRPPRPARGGRRARAVPRLPPRQLDHRPEHRRRWRPVCSGP